MSLHSIPVGGRTDYRRTWPAPAEVGRPRLFLPVVLFLTVVMGVAGCGESQTASDDPRQAAGSEQEVAGSDNVLELKAVGMRFEGPGEIASGWVTIRLENLSSMIHFALIDRLPEGVTPDVMASEVAGPFQRGMDLINAGEPEAASEAFGELPEWFADVVYIGGPGLLSGGEASEATVFLEPGRYMLECYIKTNQIFHSSPPQPGQLGMVHALTVTDEVSKAQEPEANFVLALSSRGFEHIEGEMKPGRNTIRAEFRDQDVYSNFVGHDVHVFRIEQETDLEAVGAWMNWSHPEGFETPAPAVFLGGINDMPAGSTGYFTVDLTPGNYAFVAEVPSPQEKGFLLPFTVKQ